MGYVFLLATILSEATGTTMMKISEGFSKPVPAAIAILCYACTMFFMAQSLNRLGMSLVYATWSGAGIALVTLIGIIAFKEPVQPVRLIWILCIVTGVVGLNVMRR